MSRFGLLQRRYQESKQEWADYWDYLAFAAQGLAEDFGVWLAQGENGQADTCCPDVPVKAVARYLDDEGEEAFSCDLSAGQEHKVLNFALEVELAGGERTQPPSTLRLHLSIEPFADAARVIVADSGRSYQYHRKLTPECLFADLFALCEESLAH